MARPTSSDKAVTDTVSHHDFHATLLRLFGLEQKQVAFLRPNGVGSLLEGSEGQIVWKILKDRLVTAG